MMPAIHRPSTVAELAQLIGAAAAEGSRLIIRGGGSKSQIGAPTPAAAILDMGGFAGVIDYDPAELVLTVAAATPLVQIETLVANENQMLSFEPFDFGPVFGVAAGASTIGGVVAAGMAGSRRLSGGSVRDHLLGLEAVSGRGERFVAGAKVVKNVTGYDLPKLLCGSWGRLAALTQLTLKVLPRGREQRTLVLRGLNTAQAVAAMAAAMGSQADVAAAAYVPDNISGSASVTALRVEGFGPSVAARLRMLEALLTPTATPDTLPEHLARNFWSDLRTLVPLGDVATLWRINLPTSRCVAFTDQITEQFGTRDARWMLDWAGGLIWLASDAEAHLLRAAAAAAGGHAMLIRASEALRAQVPTLHPLPPGVALLEERVRRAFDPRGVFETGRFGPSSVAAGDAN